MCKKGMRERGGGECAATPWLAQCWGGGARPRHPQRPARVGDAARPTAGAKRARPAAANGAAATRGAEATGGAEAAGQGIPQACTRPSSYRLASRSARAPPHPTPPVRTGHPPGGLPTRNSHHPGPRSATLCRSGSSPAQPSPLATAPIRCLRTRSRGGDKMDGRGVAVEPPGMAIGAPGGAVCPGSPSLGGFLLPTPSPSPSWRR